MRAVLVPTLVLVLVGVLAASLWAGLDRILVTRPGPYRTLTFSDDFEGTQLDASRWSNQRGSKPYVYGSPFNPDIEDALFTPEQVHVRDGALRLVAQPRQARDPVGGRGYNYVSGVVHSGSHFSFTYGYVEARVRVPEDPAYWPAFWMLPTPVDREWPPEIDIAEFPPASDSASLRPTFNVHWKEGDKSHVQLGSTPYGDPGRSYRGSWHVYGLLWEPGRLRVYVDGQPGPEFTGRHVPSQPMYIVLGLGVALGESPGPEAMEVDYVRVWSDDPKWD